MTSVKNLSSLGSIAIHTLREGSVTERIVLGTALFATAALLAYKIVQMASSFFAKAVPPVALPRFEMTPEAAAALDRNLQARYPLPAIEPPRRSAAPSHPAPQAPSFSLLASLTFNESVVPQEMEVSLAEALHLYQELKTEIGGDEDRFVFLATSYLQFGAAELPSLVRWEEKGVEVTIPPHYNQAFDHLEGKLRAVGLSLKNVKRSEKPLARAQFKDGTTKEIQTLADLYQTVKLQGPQILSSFEVKIKEQQVAEAKVQLHKSRMNIIDKTLSTLRAVLIKDFVTSFAEKHKELYTIVGSNPETLHFVLENICWHALDRALETVENTFIPSKEAQQKVRKIDLEAQLAHVLKDKAKLERAQAYLVQILANPDNHEAMAGLVTLLLAEEAIPERDSLVKKLQTPGLQFQEESVEQELGRLQGVQKFYHTVTIAVAVADEGKNALLQGSGDADQREKITLRRLSSPIPRRNSAADGLVTYADQIDGLSNGIVRAGATAVEEVVGQRWQESLVSLDEELAKVPHLTPDVCMRIIELGWVKFDQRQALLLIDGHHRWLITQKMIVQKLARDSLQQKGKELLHVAGRGAAFFFRTMYGRFVTALLAFDRRTRLADGAKPADRIATTFFDSVLQCHQALTQVQRKRPAAVGKREDSVVKELEDNGEMHPSAVNKPSADTVFLGQLILQLLSVLQPEGLTEDIRKVLTKALTNPGDAEPTLIRSAIQKYNESIRPAAEPWVKPIGAFLVHALQNIIEKKSTHNFASELSDRLDRVTLNAALIDFLKEDDSKISIVEQQPAGRKERVKWYREDEDRIRTLLEERSGLDGTVRALEKRLEELKAAPLGEALREITAALISTKMTMATIDLELAPQLLRRVVIANVPSNFVGYAVQFVDDLFELMQYPKVVRHIVFNVLEKSVNSLAKPLEENAEDLLLEPVNAVPDRSFFDFLFSDRLKTSIGDKIGTLFRSMSPADNSWSTMGFVVKTLTKTLPLGYFIFSNIQSKIEELIQKKFESREAINWSAARLVVTLNSRIQAYAQDLTDKGMKAVVASQLRKIIAPKEKKEPALL